MTGSIYTWLDERLGLSDVVALARHKRIPVHSQSFWYYWGGISLFLFLVQIFTGILLLVYYRPGAEAFESVRQITYVMHFGWLIRSAHSWCANLFIFSILVHMFSVYFMKAYRKPREVGWFTGIALLFLAAVFGFSGYLLPMDELSYFATKVGLQIPASIPFMGQFTTTILRGGPDVSDFTVQRFFALHVVILPLLFLPLLGVHLWLVQKHGNALPESEEAKPVAVRKTVPFFPNFFQKDLAMWLISLNVLALLASIFPWDLGKQADSLVPAPPGIHPEWYFMAPFHMLKILGNFLPGASGEVVGILLFTEGLALWVVIPFYDGENKAGSRGRNAHYFGLFAVTALIVTTVLGYWGESANSGEGPMNYPFWEVPFLGSSSVIAMIAVFHVMISQFAVGGGLWLPMAERKALREGRKDWLEQLKSHSRFFLLITGVFGTVSGVGIWFAIGLTQPEATSTLIHNFVFGWALEWVFFLIELTTIAVYYYTWDRVPAKLHLTVGWVYAASSVCTLVIINGILTFMLTPGETWLGVAGTGHEASKFWNAFFNPTYWPSLMMRTLVCITLAGVWALITGSRIKDTALKAGYLRWTTRWLVPSFVLMPLSLAWYLHMVPESQRALLSLGISTIGPGTFSQVTRLVLVMVITSATMVIITYYLAYKNPDDFTVAHACAVLMLALMATGTGEQAREMLRKPYVIGRHMYSNGTRVSEVADRNLNGYLGHTLWLNQDTSAHWAQGEAMYRGQCGACHTLTGYRSLNGLLAGRDRESIGNLLTMLHEYKPDTSYRKFMPPLTGTPGEIDALRDYLYAQSSPGAQGAGAPVLKAQK